MTPATMFDIGWARAGVHTATTDQKTRARDYLNIISTEIETWEGVQWRFLYKTSTLTTVASQRAYDLASDVAYPIHFYDTTNDTTIEVRHPEDITDLDPDEDETGDGIIVSVTGIDTTTGYWEVDIYPTPTASSETIKYRYYATIADFTSSDDTTDLAAKYPKWIQPALLHGMTALILEQQGNTRSESEWTKFGAAMTSAQRLNGKVDTMQRFSLGRSGEDEFFFRRTVVSD